MKQNRYCLSNEKREFVIGDIVNVTIMKNGYWKDSINAKVTKVGKRISVKYWQWDRVKSFDRNNVTLMELRK